MAIETDPAWPRSEPVRVLNEIESLLKSLGPGCPDSIHSALLSASRVAWRELVNHPNWRD